MTFGGHRKRADATKSIRRPSREVVEEEAMDADCDEYPEFASGGNKYNDDCDMGGR
jgi:hypothetical protein